MYFFLGCYPKCHLRQWFSNLTAHSNCLKIFYTARCLSQPRPSDSVSGRGKPGYCFKKFLDDSKGILRLRSCRTVMHIGITWGDLKGAGSWSHSQRFLPNWSGVNLWIRIWKDSRWLECTAKFERHCRAHKENDHSLEKDGKVKSQKK